MKSKIETLKKQYYSGNKSLKISLIKNILKDIANLGDNINSIYNYINNNNEANIDEAILDEIFQIILEDIIIGNTENIKKIENKMNIIKKRMEELNKLEEESKKQDELELDELLKDI